MHEKTRVREKHKDVNGKMLGKERRTDRATDYDISYIKYWMHADI